MLIKIRNLLFKVYLKIYIRIVEFCFLELTECSEMPFPMIF